MLPTKHLALARLIAYVVTGVGSIVVAYLAARGLVGDAEIAAWASVVALINGLAAFNVDTGGERPAE